MACRRYTSVQQACRSVQLASSGVTSSQAVVQLVTVIGASLVVGRQQSA